MGARIYDPALGRFLQVDPIEGGSCNAYDYVCGNPVGLTDLDGQKVGPHQAKRCALPWNINKCKRSFRTYRGKAEKAGDGVGSLGPGRSNALRQAVYAALNSKTNGSGFAKAHLHAHEQDNDAWLSFGTSGGCSNIKRDTQADIVNTSIGVKFGKDYEGSDSDMIRDLTKMVSKGQAGFDFGSPC